MCSSYDTYVTAAAVVIAAIRAERLGFVVALDNITAIDLRYSGEANESV